VDERGSHRCKGIGLRRALVLAACLALLGTFAATAAASGPTPDPGPGQKRTLAPDPTPQAAPKTVQTVTHAVSTSPGPTQYTLPASTPSSTQPAITSSRHHASTRAVATPRRTVHTVTPPQPPTASGNPAAGVLRALGYDRLAGDVRTSASSLHEGLLILGASILLLIVLGEVGFLAVSVRLVRRAI
jgi:hypothetical protein